MGCGLYIGLCMDRRDEGQVLAKLRYLSSEVEEQDKTRHGLSLYTVYTVFLLALTTAATIHEFNYP